MHGLTSVHGHAAAPRARLFLGGVGAAVRADVCHRSADRLTVRHPLPFLRLESEVMDEEGRFARISSVRVYVEDDVPTLHMELLYPAPKARRDATLPYGIATTPPPAPVGARATEREDDTLVFATEVGEPIAAAPAPAHPPGLASLLVRALKQIARRFARLWQPVLPA